MTNLILRHQSRVYCDSGPASRQTAGIHLTGFRFELGRHLRSSESIAAWTISEELARVLEFKRTLPP